MKETDIQSHVIKVVRANGGAARKLSHRFNLGVCDLLIQLPTFISKSTTNIPPMLLEVKLRHGATLHKNLRGAQFMLDVTRPQREFLKEFRAAGTRVGVLSFMEKRGLIELYGAVFELDRLERAGYRVDTLDHMPLRPMQERDAKLYRMLEDFARG